MLPQGWEFDMATILEDQGKLEEAGICHLQSDLEEGDGWMSTPASLEMTNFPKHTPLLAWCLKMIATLEF